MAEGAEPVQSAVQRPSGVLGLANDYVTLMKPPIIVLLVITAIGGMFLAAEGIPSLQTLAMVSLGGALGSGGANAINHFLDQDIDSIMSRTVRRPVASNRIAPLHGRIPDVATLDMLAWTRAQTTRRRKQALA